MFAGAYGVGKLLAGPHHGSETVLIVDSADIDRIRLGAVLRRNGYHVIEARHAGHALLSCLGHPAPIHLVLTRASMPDTTRGEVVRALTAVRPHLKALVLGDVEIFHPDAVAWTVREALDR